MTKNCILAIDQGTTGSTILLVEMGADQVPVIQARGYQEFAQYFPQPGWVEHDLEEIWTATLKAIDSCLADYAGVVGDISAIGITNQRETTGVWTPDGVPLARALVWQDRRTASFCDGLRDKGHEEVFRKKTGLVLDPYFSGTKLAWLLEHVEGLREKAKAGNARFGTIDTWLVQKLSGHDLFVTDLSNASRTLMCDIHAGAWDEDLLDLLDGIPKGMLPDIRSCSEIYGKTRGLSVLPDGIPIAGMAGDQQAALFGQGCFEPGMAKCTYGTGAFALVNTGNTSIASSRGLLSTVAWRLGNQTTYALEGSCFVAGAIVQWLRDGLGFIEDSSEIEALACEVDDSQGVVVVPALTGLGAPHWRPEARGLISGLTRGTTRAHIARAALEGIALQVFDLLDAMRQDSGQAIASLKVDGGASANSLLMQVQADLLELPIHRPNILDTTALGAAYLAALGVGLFTNVDDIQKNWSLDKTYCPQENRLYAQKLVKQWQKSVGKA
jgi:glycerol kinase